MKAASSIIFRQGGSKASPVLSRGACSLGSALAKRLPYGSIGRLVEKDDQVGYPKILALQTERSGFLGPALSSSVNRQRGLQRKQGQSFSVKAEIMQVEGSTSEYSVPKRKIIEHVVLFKMREDFNESQEKDMLDHLYSLQYHYRHIIALSLGRLAKSAKGYTHGLLVRFPTLEALRGYIIHPAHRSVVDKFVTPYCEDTLAVDFESEVEEDIEAIFRRGNVFEQGVEHVVLLKVKEDTSPESSAALLDALMELPDKLGSTIVQLTAGQNFSGRSQGFTHGLVVRVPSEEDLKAYNRHPVHREVLRRKILPISEEMLVADYSVEPVGTSLM